MRTFCFTYRQLFSSSEKVYIFPRNRCLSNILVHGYADTDVSMHTHLEGKQKILQNFYLPKPLIKTFSSLHIDILFYKVCRTLESVDEGIKKFARVEMWKFL